LREKRERERERERQRARVYSVLRGAREGGGTEDESRSNEVNDVDAAEESANV
jgi:hypothetical protein